MIFSIKKQTNFNGILNGYMIHHPDPIFYRDDLCQQFCLPANKMGDKKIDDI